MNFALRALHTVVFGNFFIATCALVMCYNTTQLFDVQLSLELALFVSFATLSSYCFHWYLTHDEANATRQLWTIKHRSLLGLMSVFALIVTGVLALPLIEYWWLLGLLGILTFLYSAPKVPYKPFIYLRGLAVAKTLYLAAVWALVTVVLPLMVAKVAWSGLIVVYLCHRFLYILAICILFDYRDRHDDRRSRMLNLVTYLSLKRLKRLYALLLTLFILSILGSWYYGLNAYQLIQLSLPALGLLLVFKTSIRTRSDYWYYIVLDGMMML